MGKLFIEYLDCKKLYRCKKCKVHIVENKSIVSKNFHGKSGKAYLFNRLINIDCGAPEDKMLLTGLHTIKAVNCVKCKTIMGWTYVHAY